MTTTQKDKRTNKHTKKQAMRRGADRKSETESNKKGEQRTPQITTYHNAQHTNTATEIHITNKKQNQKTHRILWPRNEHKKHSRKTLIVNSAQHYGWKVHSRMSLRQLTVHTRTSEQINSSQRYGTHHIKHTTDYFACYETICEKERCKKGEQWTSQTTAYNTTLKETIKETRHREAEEKKELAICTATTISNRIDYSMQH